MKEFSSFFLRGTFHKKPKNNSLCNMYILYDNLWILSRQSKKERRLTKNEKNTKSWFLFKLLNFWFWFKNWKKNMFFWIYFEFCMTIFPSGARFPSRSSGIWTARNWSVDEKKGTAHHPQPTTQQKIHAWKLYFPQFFKPTKIFSSI